MKVKGEFYTSYETHNYCPKEGIWIIKKDSQGMYCPNLCGCRLRKNPRYTNSKKDRWDKAY